MAKTHFSVRFASVLVINCWPNTSVKCHKGRNKAIKLLNTKIPTNPHKIALFHVGITYSLKKTKNPYCRDFSRRVATLLWIARLLARLQLSDLARNNADWCVTLLIGASHFLQLGPVEKAVFQQALYNQQKKQKAGSGQESAETSTLTTQVKKVVRILLQPLFCLMSFKQLPLDHRHLGYHTLLKFGEKVFFSVSCTEVVCWNAT